MTQFKARDYSHDWYAHLNGEATEDSHLHIHDALTTHMGICGCGMPDAALELIEKLLSGGTPWEKGGDERPVDDDQAKKLITVNMDGAAYLLLYVLDHWGFTEHGGNVRNSWLTDEGKKALEVLRAREDEEDAS